MNLVAKEYVAAQCDRNPGVLVLSRFAGAAQECSGALLVNPYDIESTSRAIHAALTMPLDERIARHRASLKNIEKSDIVNWGQKFLDRLIGLDNEFSLFVDIPVRGGGQANAEARQKSALRHSKTGVVNA
jgi:trehalose-6-phosphate synthase